MTQALAVPQVIGALQLTTQALRRMVEILPSWEDEKLAEFFRSCSELQNGAYWAQCLTAHILCSRYEARGLSPKEARKEVGKLLNLAPFTVYEMVLAWQKIFSELGIDDQNLPVGFYQRALRAERYGVDPVEAVRYAVHRRQVLGEDYRVTDFVRDIKQGLPEPEESPPAGKVRSCRRCLHLKAAPEGAILWLVVKGTGESQGTWLTVAVGEAKGLRYCQMRERLGQDLIPYAKTAAECGYFQPKEGA